MERLSHTHSDNFDELLSAYIDGAVDAEERSCAERLIASCAACAHAVQELRMFRTLLRELPNVQPRRSFTLDPATVAPPRRLLFPTFRWASLIAAALFLVVVGIDALNVGGGAAMPQSFVPAAAPAAGSAAKGSPTDPQRGGSNAAGGSAETMMLPLESPAAAGMADASPEVESSPMAAEIAPTAVASGPQTAVASEGVTEESPAAGGYPAAAPEPPAIARNAQSPAPEGYPAGGTAADQALQPEFRANEPAGADTLEFEQTEQAQGSWWSGSMIQIIEVLLGLIALVLGGAALWAWRRQL